jgi:hypothetical protein
MNMFITAPSGTSEIVRVESVDTRGFSKQQSGGVETEQRLGSHDVSCYDIWRQDLQLQVLDFKTCS